MDNARSFQIWTRGDGALLRKATARVKLMLLAFALAVGAASTATAVPLTINADSSWLATNAPPAATSNTDLSFNTTGWINASVNCLDRDLIVQTMLDGFHLDGPSWAISYR